MTQQNICHKYYPRRKIQSFGGVLCVLRRQLASPFGRGGKTAGFDGEGGEQSPLSHLSLTAPPKGEPMAYQLRYRRCGYYPPEKPPLRGGRWQPKADGRSKLPQSRLRSTAPLTRGAYGAYLRGCRGGFYIRPKTAGASPCPTKRQDDAGMFPCAHITKSRICIF